MDNTPKQSRSTQKTTGAKDARSLKANKNRALEAPPMPDLEAEMTVAEKLGSRGHGAHSSKVVEKVLDYVRNGMTFKQISQMKGMPTDVTLWRWKKDVPEFAEEADQAFSDYVDDLAKRTTPKLEEVFSLRGFDDKLLDESMKLPTLKDDWKRDGLYKKLQFHINHADKKARSMASVAGVILNYAGRRVNSWKEDSEGAGNIIVFDINIGDPKSLNMPGSPDGQNAGAAISVKAKVKR